MIMMVVLVLMIMIIVMVMLRQIVQRENSRQFAAKKERLCEAGTV